MDALHAPLGASDAWIDPNDLDHVWLATGDSNGGDTCSIGILETWDGGPRGRHCRWASLWKINNAFTSFARTLLRLDSFGLAVIWSLYTDDGGETFALALGLR